MMRYEKKFLTKSLDDSLTSTIAWTQNAYSQSIDEYKFKERVLRLSFQELLETPMLNKHGLKRAMTGEVDDGLSGADLDSEDELSASIGSASVHSQMTLPNENVAAGSAEAAMKPILEAPTENRGRRLTVAMQKVHH